MRLISISILLTYLKINMIVKAQKFQHEEISFPPQFPHANGVFSSDSSIFLPPESHTTLPYFTRKNDNKLSFHYLPPTGTNIPKIYPTPFPMAISSPFASNFDDNEENEIYNKNHQSALSLRNKNNSTIDLFRSTDRKDSRNINNQPIDRVDLKFPLAFSGMRITTPITLNQTPSNRRTIISAETQIPDQVTKSSYITPQYIPTASPVYVSSPSEPAIPILRLSNEMDLDGSFSYEALGADKTHYVQNSRMENLGTDNEEQVVEGSYSYVGDNGQTYTVHYIADSNGYRASGDHLPVPPPIPEIIQRAIQYNLAEEAKTPSHLQSWQEEKEHEYTDNDRNRYNIPTTRNLFTGRTPEAFSYSFSQGSNQHNNLIATASTQIPIKLNVDLPKEQIQIKANNDPIAPQITFLASQGAHIPAMNTAQQPVSRTLPNEKSSLPQLMNYEANAKELEKDNNQDLWKWQYGLNPNQANRNSNKNTISRSSGDDDDIMINFSDMTPEQYTEMIHEQINPIARENTASPEKKTSNFQSQKIEKEYNQYALSKKEKETVIYPKPTISTSISNEIPNNSQAREWYNKSYKNKEPMFVPELKLENKKLALNDKNQLVTRPEFHNTVPRSQIVTQSYDYDDSFFESDNIKTVKNERTDGIGNIQSTRNQTINEIETSSYLPVYFSTERSLKFIDFIVEEPKNNFSGVINNEIKNQQEQEIVTTTESLEELLKNNIFLKNIFNRDKTIENYYRSVSSRETDTQEEIKKDEISKTDKTPKLLQLKQKPLNEIIGLNRKSVDMSEILNYVTLKNHFESSKLKPKDKYMKNANQINDGRYISVNQQQNSEDLFENGTNQNQNNFRPLNHPQEELRGMIKNYKILQRNNNNNINRNYNSLIARDLTPPAVTLLQSQNLPPLGRAGPSMKSYLPPTYI